MSHSALIPVCLGLTDVSPITIPKASGLFVTCHIHGNMPHAKYPPPGKMNPGAAFVWTDSYAGSTRTGPVHLAQEPVASAVGAALHRGAPLGQHDLGAYAILSDHIHVLRRLESVEMSFDAADTRVRAT